MGYLLHGVWHTGAPTLAGDDGAYHRNESSFRNWITADGSPGPSGDGGFKAEAGRYHLYVSLACPWAHRALIMRRLKRLEDVISLSVVHWHMGENGWTFERGPGVIADFLNHARYLREVYLAADPDFTGRVTVPVLWDRERETIVNNESAEVIRILNSAFDAAGAEPGDYYPEPLREEIDAVNARIYDTVNNGVYKAGFATRQSAYEDAFSALFDSLDWLETRLADTDYLVGGTLTEADIRLFTTLVRFDPVYHGHFKCNLRRIADYPNLSAYLKRLYGKDGFGGTTDLFHIKNHYYTSHTMLNPSGIVPLGPELDYT